MRWPIVPPVTTFIVVYNEYGIYSNKVHDENIEPSEQAKLICTDCFLSVGRMRGQITKCLKGVPLLAVSPFYKDK
jgi:hypothetical protein